MKCDVANETDVCRSAKNRNKWDELDNEMCLSQVKNIVNPIDTVINLAQKYKKY